eukprot:g8714.t1
MEEGSGDDRCDSDGAAGSDEVEGSTGVGVDNDSSNDYHRLVQEQRAELEELKRAAREASPSNTSRYPSDERTLQPALVAPGGEMQHPLPPSPPSKHRTPIGGGRQERQVGVTGVGGDFLAAVTSRGRTTRTSGGTAVGRGGDKGSSARGADDGRSVHGYSGALASDTGGSVGGDGFGGGAVNGKSSDSGGVDAAEFAAPRTHGTGGGVPMRAGGAHQSSSWWQEDQQPPAPPLPTRLDLSRPPSAAAVAAEESRENKPPGAALDTRGGLQESGSSAPAARFSRRGEAGPGSSAPPNGARALGPSAIADEALASLEAGTVDRSVSGGAPRIAFEADAANGNLGIGGAGTDRGCRAPYYSSSMAVDGIGIRPTRGGGGGSGGGGSVIISPDDRAGKTSESLSSPPTPLKAAPTAAERQPRPAYGPRSPAAPHHAEGAADEAGFRGRDGGSMPSSAYHHETTKVLAGSGAAGLVEHGRAGTWAVGTTPRPFVGSSWGEGAGGWGGSGGSLHHGGLAVGRRGGVGGGGSDGGEPFRSASWAEKHATKREEQSVLVRQLERELASTVAALRDERRERRQQTEALRSKLDQARGALRDAETELERRERMTTTLMGELEALRLRCDRLSASREERAQEADKTMARLREDNRELEARLRQADAAAAEARAARAGADAERIRVERDLQAAREKATTTELRAQEKAEAAAAAADEAARELRVTREEQERQSSELETLRRRVDEEGTADAAGALRAQVADLERDLATAHQRCVALEARLGLLERELVEAEGGEPRRARRTPGSSSGGNGTGGAGKLGNARSRTAGLGRSGAVAVAAAADRGDEVKSVPARPPKPTTGFRQVPGGGSGGAREHVSLMRRRRERAGLGSSFASSKTVGGGRGADRRTARGGGGGLSGAGAVNSSTCSSGSRAWIP